jgi:hypothetical protein
VLRADKPVIPLLKFFVLLRVQNIGGPFEDFVDVRGVEQPAFVFALLLAGGYLEIAQPGRFG